MTRYAISVVVFLIYLLFIATSFTYGATLHVEANAYNSNQYVKLNGGVLPWSNWWGDTYVMPDYEPKLNGYHSNSEVQVVYSFPLGFYAQEATIYVGTAFPFSYFYNAYALLDVSPNGIDWANVPTNEVVDISGIVHDADTIYLRGRLWSELAPIGCQWLFTPAGGAQGLILDVQGFDFPAPEPSTIQLLTIGGLCLIILGYKRLTRGF